jgi:hypothetical protein
MKLLQSLRRSKTLTSRTIPLRLTVSNGTFCISTPSNKYDQVFGPAWQANGQDKIILDVYNNLATFGQTILWGWRVNLFCQPEDQSLWRMCSPSGYGLYAYEWDTVCEDGRCPCKTRDADGECNGQGNDGIVNDPKKSYINIMFCDTFFTKPSLEERLNWEKQGLRLRNTI